MGWIHDLREDLRFAIRQLRRAPGFTVVAVLTLALGIGANSAIFALVDATLLRPLPFPEPDRLVTIWERTDESPRSRVAPLNMIDWAERSRSFEGIAGYVPSVGGMVMASPDGATENVPRQWLPSANIFSVLGIPAVVGRTFTAADETERRNAILLSEAFWRSRFNADPAVVGRGIRLDGELFEVIGVVPGEARLVGDASVWALRPFGRNPALRGPRVLLTVGRLAKGVTIDVARTELDGIAAALAREYPATNDGYGITIEPLREAIVGPDLRLTSLLFLGVVGFVLLICCANVANLLLARATVRARELTIRMALGAGRARVVKQLLTESVLLAAIGGVGGVAIGAAILAAAPTLMPAGILPGAMTLTFDSRIIVFCLSTAILVGVLFGLAPAWQVTGSSSSPQAHGGDTRTTTGTGGRVRRALVVGEVATAVLLLFAAGLLLRTLLAIDNVDRGYRAAGVLTMMVDPMGSTYPTPSALQQFFDDVEREIRALPGVASVAWASTLPLGPSYAGQFAFEMVGAPPLDSSQQPSADYQIVSHTFFDTLDVDIVDGRSFTAFDTRDTVPVCIVNEAFARQYLGGRSPIGARIALRPAGAAQAKPVVREVVGVARQVKGRPDETSDLLQVYVPMPQQLLDDMFVLVRPTSGSGEALTASVRAAIARVDRAQLVGVRGATTLEGIAREATARHRFRAVLVMTFAGLALALAMVGVFGTLAYSVQQRIREFGLRMALGASAGSVFVLVVSGALRTVAVGVAIGLGFAAVGSRLIASMLFEVAPLDAMTFAIVTLLLMMTALMATVPVAWRAIGVDPVLTLRQE
jgi:putative ABC transport system permease protein